MYMCVYIDNGIDSAIRKKSCHLWQLGWTLSAESNGERDIRCAYLYVKSKKKTKLKLSNGFLVWGVGEMIEENQKIQT